MASDDWSDWSDDYKIIQQLEDNNKDHGTYCEVDQDNVSVAAHEEMAYFNMVYDWHSMMNDPVGVMPIVEYFDSHENATQQEINYRNMLLSAIGIVHHDPLPAHLDTSNESDELDIPLAQLRKKIQTKKIKLSYSGKHSEACHTEDIEINSTMYAGRMETDNGIHIDIFVENNSDTMTECPMPAGSDSSDYIPSSSTCSSSDESEEMLAGHSNIAPGCKRKLTLREESWKRRGKHIKRGNELRKRCRKNQQRQIQKQTTSENESEQDQNTHGENDAADDVENAIKKSLREDQIQAMLKKFHSKRLDKILASNMLERKLVPADGNCLFSAVLEHMELPMTVQELRRKVAHHLEDYIQEYKPFMSFPDILTPEEENEELVQMIREIREDGTWNTYMSDFIPLCLGNIFHKPLRIFSSRPFQPIIDVNPSISSITSETPIIIAHMAIHGSDHYDAVQPKRSKLMNQGPPAHQATAETTTNTCTPTTPSKALDSMDEIILTPHKDAEYKSPKRKKLTRKRMAKPQEWKSNVRKAARSKGLAYISKRGKHVSHRSVKEVDCSKCRFKCAEKIDDEQKLHIFQTFWNLDNFILQRSFICSHVINSEPSRAKKNGNKRTVANAYFFNTNEQRVRVCKSFFLGTLDIGKKTVENAIKNKAHGVYVGQDRRGSHPPANKTPESDVKLIRDHIESFLTIEPHYTRKDTKRKYLPQDLNIRRMYQLYTEKCGENGKKAASEHVYRNVFCKEYNLSFFHPKKDQCQLCNRYEELKSSGKLDDETEKQYEAHQRRKELARQEKENDKKRARQDPKFHAAAFDLEAVLTTPCSLIGELYYKRKLCCYNLSFYEMANGEAKCYLWDETQGKRGSCEIASCILLHQNSLTNKTSSIEQVVYYCDTCGGQNRNQFVASALLYCVQHFPQIKCISQKFLESGHSEMECDSVHSTIEHAKKLTKVYVPSQWESVITLARKKKPYVVVPLKYVDFMDFKKLRHESTGANMKYDTRGERVNWLKIKWIQVRNSCSGSIFVSSDFEASNLKEIKLKAKRTRQKKGQTKPKLCQRYTAKLPVSSAKKADLLSLCASGTIPEEYHAYYNALPCSTSSRDKLPAPGASENDEDTNED